MARKNVPPESPQPSTPATPVSDREVLQEVKALRKTLRTMAANVNILATMFFIFILAKGCTYASSRGNDFSEFCLTFCHCFA